MRRCSPSRPPNGPPKGAARTSSRGRLARVFAAASAALALGVSTGWDPGTYRVFYLGGAILSVPWLALGTVFLLFGGEAGRITTRRARVLLGPGVGRASPRRSSRSVRHRDPGRARTSFVDRRARVLAAIAQRTGCDGGDRGRGGLGRPAARATTRRPGRGRLAAANGLVALGTLILSSGGLVQGFVGHDEAFALSLATGIAVIYAGFLVADGVQPPDPRLKRNRSSPLCVSQAP